MIGATRPRLTLAAVALLTPLCALVALGLRPSTGIDTLVSRGSADYRSTQVDNRQFGSAPVVLLVRLPLTKLVQSRDLVPLSELEACLGGQQLQLDRQLGAFEPVAAAKAVPYGGRSSPCGALMRTRPAKVVYGPGTFLSRAVTAVTSEIHTLSAAAATTVKAAEAAALKLARAKGLDSSQADAAAKEAGELVLEQQLGSLSTLADQTGIDSTPSIENPAFLEKIVFGAAATGGAGAAARQPSARFSYLFPSADDALIQVRLRAGLSDAQQSRAIALIRRAMAMKRFRIPDGSYLLAGEPVLLSDLGAGISKQLLLLLLGAAVVMALVLLIGFRSRLRMLPLVLALAAAAVTFGLTSLAGASLTLAGVAVLPILIGLGVDYAVQFQSGTPVRSLVVAALATASGFLVLLLSPVPMVQGFGLLLVIGVGVALALVLVGAPAAIASIGRSVAATPGASGANVRERAPTPPRSGSRPPGAGGRRVQMLLATLALRPRGVLAVAIVLAVAGWGLGTQTGVQSDITKLVPANMPALQHLDTLERVTGVSGEIDVVIHASNVATPSAVAWMVSYERQVLAHFGYAAGQGCAGATLCPALSLPDLFELGGSGTAGLTQRSISALLATVPGYFQRAVITPDRRYATLAFGIRLMPLSRQRRVIAYMRGQLHPPAGVSAALAGLPVLAADADGSLASGLRRTLTLVAGLLAVGLVLLAVFRNPRRALIPLAPIVLATGWSALVIYLLGIPLNPMSATLGALVIAISTEFSVLLCERVRAEHRDGWSLAGAIERAYRSTGAAVLISGITAISGFGVLVLSNISMLRDFGFVTLIDLSVSLAGVLLVLPAVITLARPRPQAQRDPKPQSRTRAPAPASAPAPAPIALPKP